MRRALTPSPCSTSYSVTVPHGTTHARLVPKSTNDALEIETGPESGTLTRLPAGAGNGPAVALAVGENGLVAKTRIGDRSATCKVTITREQKAASTDADLSGLSAEARTDSKWSALDIGTFSKGTTEYSATVPHRMSKARLTATVPDSNATLKAGAGSNLGGDVREQKRGDRPRSGLQRAVRRGHGRGRDDQDLRGTGGAERPAQTVDGGVRERAGRARREGGVHPGRALSEALGAGASEATACRSDGT